MKEEFEHKRILITGGAGSLGSWIIEELLKFNPKLIIVLDIDETAAFNLINKYPHVNNLRFQLGDVRDPERLKSVMENVDLVFHFAALKHVWVCEYNIFEAIKSNIYGTQNIINAALQNKVSKVIFSSSDKAANPKNAMGTTKLLGEMLMTSANSYESNKRTIFSSVRFGNVMGTRGSVIPLFKKQIEDNMPLTITDPDMTRFMMSLNQAMHLLFKCAKLAKGGELFIFKMPVLKVSDLAKSMLDYYKKDYKNNIKIIGPKPGETMYEELMTEEESRRAIETNELFVINPLKNGDVSDYENYYGGKKLANINRYNSRDEELLTHNQIIGLLKNANLL